MKIIIDHKPELFGDDFFETDNYDLKATIDIPDDATATEATLAFCKAMSIEGYFDKSVVAALLDAANYMLGD